MSKYFIKVSDEDGFKLPAVVLAALNIPSAVPSIPTYYGETEPVVPEGTGLFLWWQTDSTGKIIDLRQGTA